MHKLFVVGVEGSRVCVVLRSGLGQSEAGILMCPGMGTWGN